MRMQNCHDRDRGEQERKRISETVRVIDGRYEHDAQHRAVIKTFASREDIKRTSLQHEVRVGTGGGNRDSTLCDESKKV